MRAISISTGYETPGTGRISMNPIQTIRTGILACAAACALGACTQPANGPYGTRGAPADSRGAQSTTTMPDAHARDATRVP
jgi:hypothetical protein